MLFTKHRTHHWIVALYYKRTKENKKLENIWIYNSKGFLTYLETEANRTVIK